MCVKSTVLQVKNLHKQYHRGRPRCLGLKRSGGRGRRDAAKEVKVAISDSSFAVDAGEIFGLLGPNGAGKSTTLSCIIAETKPTAGKVIIVTYLLFIQQMQPQIKYVQHMI